jgi:hypothetical protein
MKSIISKYFVYWLQLNFPQRSFNFDQVATLSGEQNGYVYEELEGAWAEHLIEPDSTEGCGTQFTLSNKGARLAFAINRQLAAKGAVLRSDLSWTQWNPRHLKNFSQDEEEHEHEDIVHPFTVLTGQLKKRGKKTDWVGGLVHVWAHHQEEAAQEALRDKRRKNLYALAVVLGWHEDLTPQGTEIPASAWNQLKTCLPKGQSQELPEEVFVEVEDSAILGYAPDGITFIQWEDILNYECYAEMRETAPEEAEALERFCAFLEDDPEAESLVDVSDLRMVIDHPDMPFDKTFASMWKAGGSGYDAERDEMEIERRSAMIDHRSAASHMLT